MIAMIFVLRWTWVLGIALFLPVGLPAGGSENFQLEYSLFEKANSLFISDSCVLKASPCIYAPSLRTLNLGTPLQVLRRYQGKDGNEWIHVRIFSNERMEFDSFVRRGWLNVSNT